MDGWAGVCRILAYLEVLEELVQAVLGPGRGVLLRPVPVVHVGGVGTLLHNPARISFSPLGHRLILTGIISLSLYKKLRDKGAILIRQC